MNIEFEDYFKEGFKSVEDIDPKEFDFTAQQPGHDVKTSEKRVFEDVDSVPEERAGIIPAEPNL